jgi:hypothetical protein
MPPVSTSPCRTGNFTKMASRWLPLLLRLDCASGNMSDCFPTIDLNGFYAITESSSRAAQMSPAEQTSRVARSPTFSRTRTRASCSSKTPAFWRNSNASVTQFAESKKSSSWIRKLQLRQAFSGSRISSSAAGCFAPRATAGRKSVSQTCARKTSSRLFTPPAQLARRRECS